MTIMTRPSNVIYVSIFMKRLEKEGIIVPSHY